MPPASTALRGRQGRDRRRSRRDTGELDDVALAKLCAEIAAAREPTGTRSCWCPRARSRPACPPSVSPRAPPTSASLQAVAAVGQPLLDGAHRRDPRAGTGSSRARCCSRRTTSACARSTSTRATPCAACSISGWSPSSTRTTPSPTTRSATATTTASPRSCRTSCSADVLVLLTDTPGLFTADPRLDEDASLIEEIVEVDAALEAVAGGTGTDRGSGGMASKLAAAKIAAWSGVRAVIAGADVPDVIVDAIEGRAVGTVGPSEAAAAPEPQAVDRVRARRRRADRRRRRRAPRPVRRQPLAAPRGRARGRGRVRRRRRGGDRGRRRRAVRQGPGAVLGGVARGRWRGASTTDLGEGLPHEVVHRDDLVVLP